MVPWALSSRTSQLCCWDPPGPDVGPGCLQVPAVTSRPPPAAGSWRTDRRRAGSAGVSKVLPVSEGHMSLVQSSWWTSCRQHGAAVAAMLSGCSAQPLCAPELPRLRELLRACDFSGLLHSQNAGRSRCVGLPLCSWRPEAALSSGEGLEWPHVCSPFPPGGLAMAVTMAGLCIMESPSGCWS